MQYYIECLKKYVVFSGRARRKEFWMFFLFDKIILIALYILACLLCSLGSAALCQIAVVMIVLYCFAIILPTLSVTIRRLHDVGMSGWWVLIVFIPLGGLVILGMMAADSQPDDNKYGPNPKLQKVKL